ncbi:MAG TPA: hypothetical protein VFT43_05475, partial [Candidatus Polarisedimenticolia bacterium]|nr:hypothetical protein [Candidatus Polarisedimenticolia bacterium]
MRRLPSRFLFQSAALLWALSALGCQGATNDTTKIMSSTPPLDGEWFVTSATSLAELAGLNGPRLIYGSFRITQAGSSFSL